MRTLTRGLVALAVLALAVTGVAYGLAGRGAAPRLTIQHPTRVMGRSTTLELTVDVRRDQLRTLAVNIEQNGRSIPVFALDATTAESLQSDDAEGTRLSHVMGRNTLPGLQAGPATIVAVGSRRVLFGLRTLSLRATLPVQVRLDPPTITVVSTHHYVNQGGSEMIVYRITPPDVESGVRVGDFTYPGFPAAGPDDPALKVAFFALLYDQDPDAPMELFALDEAGNEAHAPFDHRVFRKIFKRSRIDISDAFLARVVPAILQGSPNLNVPASSPDLVPAFLAINGDLRKMNAKTILGQAQRTSPTMLWTRAFRQLGNSKVEASFADDRTYVHAGKDIDRQVHLGFDLAVTANVPVLAANDGIVIYAKVLGIYGNCVIIDHGMGVQSLYGHLSSFDVQEGQDVTQGQRIGRSGETGLAGGDHLHFTMLVNGQAVNPAEWWDPHWIEDRVTRKLKEAGL
jgi:murein DD-endopeptidase MepM/ murein hydrolase activator NlpD